MIKLNASYSKKVPADQEYSSKSFLACIEVELPTGATAKELQAKIHDTFELVKASVEAEITGQETPGSSQPKPRSQERSEAPVKASNKQIKYLLDLGKAREKRLADLNVEAGRFPMLKHGATPVMNMDTMWAKLKDFFAVDYKYPERYWVTVLALYHGFRVNEICSLHLKDIYQDEDDVWVMDIKEDGVKKTVKTTSSVRIVPVHPFVLDTLDFMGLVEARKRQGTKGDLLFPNLTYTETQGYAKKISVWFRQWKKTWLPVECHHKNFHSLRHTFAQQAQNQAKMSDRCNQEITGHSIAGVSAVHLGYSGRLKPRDVLEELKKVKYGWE